MSLVDTATGEVVDVLDETTAETLAHEISLRFNQLNATAGELIELAHAAYIGRAWVALGFGSWEELCDEMRLQTEAMLDLYRDLDGARKGHIRALSKQRQGPHIAGL